jgi:membrane-associated phospholipid phosphatase
MRNVTINREKGIIYMAKVVSMIFTPLYLPLVGLIILFLFSYMNLLPLEYRLMVLTLVYFFTILLPMFLIYLYRRMQGWNRLEISHKHRRLVPYIISIVCYFTCLYVLESLHIYHFVSSIVIGALVVQVTCAIINIWWKISTHTAAIGGVAGALFVFADIFGFNPTWWFCLVFIVAGILGSARMILRQHSLSQVIGGFGVGLVCASLGIIFL